MKYTIGIILWLLGNIYPLYAQSKNMYQGGKVEVDKQISFAEKTMKQAKYDEATKLYELAIEQAHQINYTDGVIEGHLGLASCKFSQWDSSGAIHQVFMAEKNTQNQPVYMARIYFMKAIILNRAKLYSDALKRYQLSVDYAQKIEDKTLSKNRIARAYVNMSTIYAHLEDYNQALKFSYKSFEADDLETKLISATNLADYYYLINKMDSTKKYLQFTENRMDEIPEGTTKANINGGYQTTKALYEMKLGNYDTAIQALKKNAWGSNVYTPEELLGIAYAKIGKKDSAILYFNQYAENKMNRKLTEVDLHKASSIIYNDEQEALQEKHRQDRNKLLLILSLAGLSVVLLILTIFAVRKSTRQRTQILEAEKQRLSIEKELAELRKNQVQNQMLAASLQLEQKNKALEELKHQLKHNKDFNINNYFKNEALIDKDFANIHHIVKEVQPTFFKMLHEHAIAKLTNLDLKYAAYIYLKMNNAQIAATLNVDPKTVSVTKYRLKQKLGLEKDTDLNTFIRNLQE